MLCFAGFFSLQYGHISAVTLTSFLQLKQAAICYPIEINKYVSDINVVLNDTCRLEFTNNITHHAPLRFRLSQITLDESVSQANCSAAIVAVNFE